jgi:hypothetical protein
MKEHKVPKEQITKEDREEAARFYFHSLTGMQRDWVERGEMEEAMDSDVIALAGLLSKVRSLAHKEGFLAGTAALVKSTEKVRERRIA